MNPSTIRPSETFSWDQAKFDLLDIAVQLALPPVRPSKIKIMFDGSFLCWYDIGGWYRYTARDDFDSAFLLGLTKTEECYSSGQEATNDLDTNQLFNVDPWVDQDNRTEAMTAWGVS